MHKDYPVSSCFYDYRTYLSQRVQAQCKGLKEHRDGFNRDNIGATVFKKGFHILPVSVTRENLGVGCDAVEDTIDISLQLYFCSNKDNRKEIDDALAKAHCVANSIMLKSNYSEEEGVCNIQVSSITPSFLATNDNAIIIDISLTISIAHCLDCCE